jgi:hypothetical protein
MEETVTGKWKKQWLGEGRNSDWEMEEIVTGRRKKQ